MKILTNKFLILFSIGLNIGFILFTAYHILTPKVLWSAKAIDSSLKALDHADVDKKTRKAVILEVERLHKELKNIHKTLHWKRLEIVKEFSTRKKDFNKIDNLSEEIRSMAHNKDYIFTKHMKKMDSLLKDKSHIYFQSIYKDIKARFDRKK